MPTIIHRTRGLLDLRAITVLGLSAKPSTENPIGMFGTGLKYAIATLCRNGCAPVLWIGRDRYTFAAKPGKFRGTDYQQLRFKLERPGLLQPRYVALPYTTEYGKFWRVWQAFREIESNTRDEGGETWREEFAAADYVGRDGETAIAIDLPEYVEAWEWRDQVFLPGGARAPDVGGPKVQVFEEGPRDKIYWRGLRVADIAPKRTLRTYNFLSDEKLTEDRTLASQFSVLWELGAFVLASDDEAFVREVVTAGPDCWEAGVVYPSHVKPGETFLHVTAASKSRASRSALDHASRYAPASSSLAVSEWAKAARPWFVANGGIYDKHARKIFAAPDDFAGNWEKLARSLCDTVNGASLPEEEAPPHSAADMPDDQIPF